MAQRLEISLPPLEERGFEDGEHKARPLESVRGADAYVVQGMSGEESSAPFRALLDPAQWRPVLNRGLVWPMTRFADRSSAGKLLGAELKKRNLANPVVLALPRGGVPVGLEVAKALGAPLDLILVRKIGAPFQPELAIGSVSDGESPDIVYNERILKSLDISREQVESAAKEELREIERRRALYLKNRPPVPIEKRVAVVIDDGIATGATLKAAVLAARRRSPSRVIVAAPVGAPDTVAELRTLADDVVCLDTPEGLFAIGDYYDDFHQLTDAEVADLLAQSTGAGGPYYPR